MLYLKGRTADLAEDAFGQGDSGDGEDAPSGDAPSKKRSVLYIVACIIGICAIAFLAVRLLGHLEIAVYTVLLTLFLVFILHRFVDMLERHGIRRGFGTLIGYLMVFGIIALFGAIIGPAVWEQTVNFFKEVPDYASGFSAWAGNLWNQYGYLLSNETIAGTLSGVTSALSEWSTNLAKTMAEGIVTTITSLVSLFIVLLMSFVAAWWLIVDYHRIGRECKIIIGPKHQDGFEAVFRICGHSFGGYLKGIVLASLCTGTIAYVGFLIIGQPYPFVLALVTALMNFIPVLGPWLAGIFAAIIGLTVSPFTCAMSILVTIFAQQFTDNFITPKVMSNTVALHPALVLFALAIGMGVGGLIGMIFAVPLTAVAKSLYAYYFEQKTGRELSSEDGAIFRKPRAG